MDDVNDGPPIQIGEDGTPRRKLIVALVPHERIGPKKGAVGYDEDEHDAGMMDFWLPVYENHTEFVVDNRTEGGGLPTYCVVWVPVTWSDDEGEA